MSSPSPQRDTSSVAAKANYTSLVDFHHDLSLFSCEPSAEFRPIGSALTTKRKEEAETGQTHKTACRLGFLFNDIIPDTPALRKAYGKRTSEILSKPETNPQGTNDDGPFRAFIGADCTSIWAAATSGDAAIAMVLLACMLADSFDAKTAVSIWSELVEQRKRNIQSTLEGSKIINPYTIVAAQQDITRSELGTWDASARSWLRRADLAMKREKKKFTRIVSKIAVPYPGGNSVFERVTTTWIRAMEVLESLLSNRPQQTRDRAILAGVPAWHLYPDLLIFQSEAKGITFHDDLVPNSGVLSLGLEYKDAASDEFIGWSLALSHLRYYGDPVLVKSNDTVKRIDMSDIWPIALGSLLYHWEVPYTSIRTAMAWFEHLGKNLHRSSSCGHAALSWLLRLCDSVTGLDDKQREIKENLVKYGRRRGSCFLGTREENNTQTPFFGLCNPAMFSSMTEENEAEVYILWLRHISNQVCLEVRNAVVSYKGTVEGKEYTEWATIRPVEQSLAAGIVAGASRYIRWIHCPLQDRDVLCHTALHKRAEAIRQRGEMCNLVLDDRGFLYSAPYSAGGLEWHNPPQLFQQQGSHRFRSWFGGKRYGLQGLDIWIKCDTREAKQWDSQIQKALMKHNLLHQGLQWMASGENSERVVAYLLSYFSQARFGSYPISGQKRKRSRSLSSEPALRETLNDEIQLLNKMTSTIPRSPELILVFRSLEIVNSLYEGLPGANISLGVVEQDLLKACWLPSSMKSILEHINDLTAPRPTGQYDAFEKISSTSIDDHIKAMTRQDMFACVAMFESGRFNVDPSRLTEVIALCHENSIFVAQILLSDPSINSSLLGLTHRVGNVGHAGMVFMVSPLEPRVRPVRHNPFSVNHRQYDFTSADMLQGTSLHLSFTTWKVPLDWEYTGEIDQEIFLLEAVVSVQDNGTWLADIDVLRIETSGPDVVAFPCSCTPSQDLPEIDAVSLDTWEELLDSPPCMGVLRAEGNWVARLAASSILVQQGRGDAAIIIQGNRICWPCLLELYSDPEPHLPEIIIQ